MTARCLSTLVVMPEEGYSASALVRLSDRRKLPYQLNFSRTTLTEIRAEIAGKMSISGFQDKLSLRLSRGVFTVVGEGGEYILKPIPGVGLPRLHNDVPANEHLTMQLADQVFGMRVAANALIRLSDGELAYITRRFDRTSSGNKVAQEDFCQLMGIATKFKYKSSYEALGSALQRYSYAFTKEREDLLRRIVFNYAVSNGDAHLRNFSMMEMSSGDFSLTPAYDLLCSGLHLPKEARLAMDLFDGGTCNGVENEGFETGGDFVALGRRFGIPASRAQAIVDGPAAHQKAVHALVNASFLGVKAKRLYVRKYNDRVQALSL